MSLRKIIAIAVVFIVIILVFFVLFKNSNQTPAGPQSAGQNTYDGKWPTRVQNQDEVTVVVTPTELSPETWEWKFEVTLDTHTGELSQDMTKNSILIDDQGKQYQPTSWEGAAPGGHHQKGVLVFRSINPRPKSVELRLLNIGKTAVRSFTWQI